MKLKEYSFLLAYSFFRSMFISALLFLAFIVTAFAIS